MGWFKNRSGHEYSGRHGSSACSNEERLENPASKAIIYRSEIDYISRCILDYPNIETGGQLFGYWTALGVPVVMYVIGPGRNAQHNPTSFIQDQSYLQEVGKELHRIFRLQHIGEWHSHHQLDLAQPSGGDVNTMQYGVGKPGFPRLLLCIGNCTATHTTVNAFNFHERDPKNYTQARWDIVETDSPYRKLADEELKRMLIHPYTRHASHADLNTRNRAANESDRTVSHWLMEKPENVEMMKAFISRIETAFPATPAKAVMLQSGEPAITFNDSKNQIKLPYGFPHKAPELYKLDASGHETPFSPNGREPVWNPYTQELLSAFNEWVASIFTKEEYSCGIPAVQNDTTVTPKVQEEQGDNGMQIEPACSGPATVVESATESPTTTTDSIISKYKEILNEKLPRNAWAWNETTCGTVIHMLAFPAIINQQVILRMVLRPEQQPEVMITNCFVDECIHELPEGFDYMEYFSLADGLFPHAAVFHEKMSAWEKYKSVYRSYLSLCVILEQHKRNIDGDRGAYDVLIKIIEDEELLSIALNSIEKICLTNK